MAKILQSLLKLEGDTIVGLAVCSLRFDYAKVVNIVLLDS